MKKIAKSIGLASLVLALSMFGFNANLARAATPILTSVVVTPATPTIMVAGTVQLTATPLDQNMVPFSGATTTFSSGSPSIATVNSTTGMVTGVANGTSTITATSVFGSTTVTGTSTVTVNTPVITNNAITNPATSITSTDATLNGTNGGSDAIGHSFWASLAPFVTTSSTLPAGVYSTPDLGAITANTSFSASLSSVTGLPAITPSTLYYFAAWSKVGSTWYPGDILSFTTAGTSTTNPVLTSVALMSSDGTYSVMVGGTTQYTATPRDQNDDPFIGATTTFTSSDPSIATVDSATGMVTGVAEGTATITATSVSGNVTVTDSATITVTTTPVVPGGGNDQNGNGHMRDNGNNHKDNGHSFDKGNGNQANDPHWQNNGNNGNGNNWNNGSNGNGRRNGR